MTQLAESRNPHGPDPGVIARRAAGRIPRARICHATIRYHRRRRASVRHRACACTISSRGCGCLLFVGLSLLGGERRLDREPRRGLARGGLPASCNLGLAVRVVGGRGGGGPSQAGPARAVIIFWTMYLQGLGPPGTGVTVRVHVIDLHDLIPVAMLLLA